MPTLKGLELAAFALTSISAFAADPLPNAIAAPGETGMRPAAFRACPIRPIIFS